MQATYKLLIADDHPLYRAALAQMLRRSFAGRPPALLEAATMTQIQQVLRATPEVDLLLDLHMPGASGLGGLAVLREEFPLVPVAVISGDRRPAAARVSMHLGAVAYLPKTLPPEELAKIVNGLLEGKHWFPDYTEEPDAEEVADLAAFAGRVGRLTRQQSQIYEMAAAGLLNKQIGYELGISLPTVKSHMTAMFHTLKVRDRKQLIVMAKSLELYSQEDFRD